MTAVTWETRQRAKEKVTSATWARLRSPSMLLTESRRESYERHLCASEIPFHVIDREQKKEIQLYRYERHLSDRQRVRIISFPVHCILIIPHHFRIDNDDVNDTAH